MDNQLNEIFQLYDTIYSNKEILLEYIEKNPSKVLMNPLQKMFVTSKYSEGGSGRVHRAVDLRAASGTKFYSPSSGVVTDANFYDNSCGGTLRIKHDNGFESAFCHVKELFVSAGDTVNPQEELGLTGGNINDYGRGNSKNAHLHFSLKKNGVPVNPMSYVGSIEEVLVNDPRFEQLDKDGKDEILSKVKEFFTTGPSGLKVAAGLAGLYYILNKVSKSKALTSTPNPSKTNPTEWPEDYTAKYFADVIRGILPG